MQFILFVLAGVLAIACPATLGAQDDGVASVTITVRGDSVPVAGALVRSGSVARLSDAIGVARLVLGSGERRISITRLGFEPQTVVVRLRAAQDTTIDVRLIATTSGLAPIVVSATRSVKRIEDEPIRVEVITAEEVEEKVFMTPGDVAMLLNESSGLSVQTTSPSLGGANVRVQGVSGRYTQILSDGLPLYGGQAGSLGLMQIPPMDLAQVEVIKGAASALYGPSALGGVIDLISRRPNREGETELLLNKTSRQGSDAVFWSSGAVASRWGYTVLSGLHRQRRVDLDDDGWTDMPGYTRGVVRPRLFWDSESGRSLFATLGGTTETREGGTMPGRVAPNGDLHVESLDTRRLDAGVVARLPIGAKLVTVRGSATEQRHEHLFGDTEEIDRHRTGFAEATLGIPGPVSTLVVGAAFQRDEYVSRRVSGFDYVFSIPSLFAQGELTPVEWLALSASARLDAHSEYGTFVSPRLSALARAPGGWTVRASAGGGSFAPTPFTEETEVIGLTTLVPFSDLELDAERIRGASLDVGRVVGEVEVVATVFASRITSPIALVNSTRPGAPGSLELVNATEPTRTRGTEFLVRYTAEPWHVTATHTYLRSTGFDPANGGRRTVPLTPSHAAGLVAMYETGEKGRIGAELYFTGRQSLEENPYRTRSRPYVVAGLLAERRLGRTRWFVNGENLTNVRQTRFDRLVRPARGTGGRWTTDAWTLLDGRVVNGGVRLEL